MIRYINNMITLLYIFGCCTKKSQGLELVETVSTVWVTQEHTAKLECKVDTFFQWCYWEKLDSFKKYYLQEWGDAQRGPIFISKINSSCKLEIDFGKVSDEDLKGYLGKWKCHLANTDGDSGQSNYKVEHIVSLHLAVTSDISFFINYTDETGSRDQSKANSTSILLPSSDELRQKQKLIASNETTYVLKDSKDEHESSYLPLIAGRVITLSCTTNVQNAEPKPKLSLWIVSSNEEKLLTTETESYTLKPHIKDNRKKFACLSFQSNEFISINATKKSTVPIHILTKPTIIEYPNIQNMLQSNDREYVTFNVRFFAQPPLKSITWLLNGNSLKPNDSLYLKNNKTVHVSDIIHLHKDKKSTFQVQMKISKVLLSAEHIANISLSIGNRLGETQWAFKDAGPQIETIHELSIPQKITYVIIIIFLLTLLIIIWCIFCPCQLWRKKTQSTVPIKDSTRNSDNYNNENNRDDHDNNYLSPQSLLCNENETKDEFKKNCLSLQSPRKAEDDFNSEPAWNDLMIPTDNTWIKLKSMSHDDTQVPEESANNFDIEYIDHSPTSIPNSTIKIDDISITKLLTPPLDYSSKFPLQTFFPPYPVPDNAKDLDGERKLIEVKDEHTQTLKRIKVPKNQLNYDASAGNSTTKSMERNVSSISQKTATIKKNFITTGPTAYPVFNSQSQTLYKDFRGSTVETTWIQKSKEEKD